MKSLQLTITVCLVLLGCDKENPPPEACLMCFPVIGDTSVLFELNAGKSLNYKGLSNALAYRWDFEGDSVWDTGFRTESSIGHYFMNPGTRKVIVEVSDFFGMTDTASIVVTVFGMNNDIGTLTDPRDGQVYRTVRLNGAWWMAENLRFGMVINISEEQKDNGIVEMYRWHGPPNLDTLGGIYSWREALNHDIGDRQGICPDGWHLPSNNEWESLISGMPRFYAYRFFGTNGLSGLNLHLCNGIYRGESETITSLSSGFWSSSFIRDEGAIRPNFLVYEHLGPYIGVAYYLARDTYDPTKVLFKSVRCKKD